MERRKNHYHNIFNRKQLLRKFSKCGENLHCSKEPCSVNCTAASRHCSLDKSFSGAIYKVDFSVRDKWTDSNLSTKIYHNFRWYNFKTKLCWTMFRCSFLFVASVMNVTCDVFVLFAVHWMIAEYFLALFLNDLFSRNSLYLFLMVSELLFFFVISIIVDR